MAYPDDDVPGNEGSMVVYCVPPRLTKIICLVFKFVPKKSVYLASCDTNLIDTTFILIKMH